MSNRLRLSMLGWALSTSRARSMWSLAFKSMTPWILEREGGRKGGRVSLMCKAKRSA